jgi:conjugal transfer/entry exclusion protein
VATVDTELAPDVAATVAKLRATNEQIAQLTADADQYKAQLREALQPGAYTVGGQAAISVTPTRRFNPEHAAAVLPPHLLDAIQRRQVDAKLAKETLPPALYDACSVEVGKATVKLA